MYDYQTEKNAIFTEQGQKDFLQIRDRVQSLLKTSGAVRLQEAVNGIGRDSWFGLACIDRLVELGELREVPTEGATQHRVFVKG